jgi:hypothetical protein
VWDSKFTTQVAHYRGIQKSTFLGHAKI